MNSRRHVVQSRHIVRTDMDISTDVFLSAHAASHPENLSAKEYGTVDSDTAQFLHPQEAGTLQEEHRAGFFRLCWRKTGARPVSTRKRLNARSPGDLSIQYRDVRSPILLRIVLFDDCYDCDRISVFHQKYIAESQHWRKRRELRLTGI